MSSALKRGSELLLSVLAFSVSLTLSAFLPWFLAVCIPAMIIWWTVQYYDHRRVERRLAGLCERCGYDLRATPDRWPECGAVPAKAAT